MLVLDFADLGPPRMGRRCGEGASQYSLVAESQRFQGSHTFLSTKAFYSDQRQKHTKGLSSQGHALEEPQLSVFRGKLRHNDKGFALDEPRVSGRGLPPR